MQYTPRSEEGGSYRAVLGISATLSCDETARAPFIHRTTLPVENELKTIANSPQSQNHPASLQPTVDYSYFISSYTLPAVAKASTYDEALRG